jgi:predicted enzyme related to lactoylglutathione lyase
MTTAFAFTKLVVRDLDAMTHFYGVVYGLESLQRVEAAIDGAPIEEVILGRDGDYGGLILLRWVDREPPEQGEVILGFTTPDIDDLCARAEGAGATVRVPPFFSEEAGGLRVAFVADPEGHLAELVEQG